jgi:hypothetical protein
MSPSPAAEPRPKRRLILTSPDLSGFALESIDASHLELLRQWKNGERAKFFFQQEISPEAQREWFAGYLARPDDWMFLIRANGVSAGCIGYRLLDGAADLYNLLRDPALDHRSTAHSDALDLLTNYIARTHNLPIRGRVLASNAAIRWSRPRGFRIVGQGEHNGLVFNILEQDPKLRIPYPVSVDSPDPQP